MLFGAKKSKRIYLDYAAATPVRPEVMKVMQPFFTEEFANPSAIHNEGQSARRVVETARLEVARLLEVREDGVLFTASGTESNNLAIAGVIENSVALGKPYTEMEIITTDIEHPSVTQMVEHYVNLGVKKKSVSVGTDGVIDVNDLVQKLSLSTTLVTFAYVNSEIGTIAPVRKIVRAVHSFNKEQGTNILVHVDAAQAPLWLPCLLGQLGVDLLSLDAGKCYGPKGVGILAVRHGVVLKPYLFGGGQERGLRPGTENTPLIVGAARALVLAQASYKERSEQVQKLRDYAVLKLLAIEGVMLNGSRTERVANNINISVVGVESEFAVITLDVAGIACSTKSACGSGKGVGSSVVRTISGDEDRALTSLRFTLGEATTASEIDVMVSVLSAHITKTRALTKN